MKQLLKRDHDYEKISDISCKGCDTMNVMKKYWDTVYLCQLLLAPLSCLCAGIYYTLCRLYGQYIQAPWPYVILFDCSQILYLVIAILLLLQRNHIAVGLYIRSIKCYVTVCLLLQYAFIMLLFPASHTWGYSFLFLVFIMFSFDFRLMVLNQISYFLVAVAAHILFPAQHLYNNAGDPREALCFRLIVYLLYSFLSAAITYFVEKFLRRIQLDENESRELALKQLTYYQNLDLMDKELRKFRHDIINHFLCMNDLLNRGDIPELKKYFTALTNSYPENSQLYFSGNAIIDSILNYDLIHLCQPNVKPVIYGRLPEITAVSSMDLCTVFSNMLSNAIKGANGNRAENELSIKFRNGEHYFSICVVNEKMTSAKDSDSRDPKSTHAHGIEDSRAHGYGVSNILEIVEKYNGIFEQNEEPDENGLFAMQVYLPI